MDQNIFISIVIPLFNKALYIGGTLQSIARQTYKNYEVVIVDDGSTDNGVDLIKKEYYNDKINIIEKENGGPSSARNRGVKEAKGDWIIFLDADDYLLPDALDTFAAIITKHAGMNYFVGNFYNMINPQSIQLSSKIGINKVLKNPFFYEATRLLTETSGTACFKKELLLEEPFNESLRRYEDAERQYRLMRKYPIYMFSAPVSVINRASAAASKPRKDVNEDFVAHLVFKGKSFWEQMTLYLLALDCKFCYPKYAKDHYDWVFKRVDYQITFFF